MLNPVFGCYEFNNELQGISTTDQFVTRLKLLAVDCNFVVDSKSYVDSMIRGSIVSGTSSAKILWRKCNFVTIVCLVCLHMVMFFVYWIISLLAQPTLIFENSLIQQRKLLNTEDLFMNTIF